MCRAKGPLLQDLSLVGMGLCRHQQMVEVGLGAGSRLLSLGQAGRDQSERLRLLALFVLGTWAELDRKKMSLSRLRGCWQKTTSCGWQGPHALKNDWRTARQYSCGLHLVLSKSESQSPSPVPKTSYNSKSLGSSLLSVSKQAPGQNVIISLPTNYGKTLIAAKVIELGLHQT